MKIKDLRVGDILLYDLDSKGWVFKLQSWMDCGRANHSAIYVEDGKVLHTTIDRGITEMFKIDSNFFKENNVKIVRLKRGTRNRKLLRRSIIKYIKNNIGKRYSFIDLGYAAVKSIIYKMTWGKIDLPMISIVERDICSELVYEIYKGAGYNIEGVTPNDLDRENIFYTIKDYEEVDNG